MINQLKTILQIKLLEIEGLSSGVAKPDDIIEDNEIYYGYEITYTNTSSTSDYAFDDYRIVITGRLVGKNKSLNEIDFYGEKIREALQSLRFKTTIQDTISYDETLKKKIINGNASMNTSTFDIR